MMGTKIWKTKSLRIVLYRTWGPSLPRNIGLARMLAQGLDHQRHRGRCSGVRRGRALRSRKKMLHFWSGSWNTESEFWVSIGVKMLGYRSFSSKFRSQGRLDMVLFWKDVAAKVSLPFARVTPAYVSRFGKAPHHSRASWMKFWRRHKHELNRTDGDEPLPQPPDKKMRYSREDDVLLAKYFCNKPEGTSDKIFQAFGRMVRNSPF